MVAFDHSYFLYNVNLEIVEIRAVFVQRLMLSHAFNAHIHCLNEQIIISLKIAYLIYEGVSKCSCTNAISF